MLKIGYFSKLSRISIRMLRHYNDIGLLVPNTVDPGTGYRYYSASQLVLANRNAELKAMGFGLAEIAEVLATYGDTDAFLNYVAGKRGQVEKQMEALGEQLTRLTAIYNRLEKGEAIMKYNVVLKEMPARKVASVRQVIPSYEQEGMLWGILMQETAPLSVRWAEQCLSVAIFHDKEYKEADVDVEIQMSVEGDYTDTEHVRFKETQAVQVASATYKGTYSEVGAANEAVVQWMEDNGYEPSDVMFNIYHVSPHQTPNPEEWVTEVCYPVRKRAK